MILQLENKEENFFPSINDGYRKRVRSFICKVPKEEVEALAAMSIEEDTNDTSNEVVGIDLKDPFDGEKPDYGRKDKQPRRCLEGGIVFDVMEYFKGQGARSLVRCLKKNGDDDDDVSFEVVDPLTSLKGKHVLVVCAFVPSSWCGSDATWLCRLWVLSKEIACNDDFEILIVAKMRSKYESSMGAFEKFLSGFPNRLAISFDDPDLRDELCYNLGFRGELSGILIDPDGKIVQQNLGFLEEGGASAFPFTRESLNAALKEDVSSLTGLLRCDPSTRLYKFGFPSESITVEQLSKKLVGLYVFSEGNKLDMLHDVYHRCQLVDKSNCMEPRFEIVIFCLPSPDLDPATFESEVHTLLNKLKPKIDASSWWVCPYDNSAGLRLGNMTMGYGRVGDAMVTVGPNGGFVDYCGGELIRNVGFEAYPFSTEALALRFAELAEQITLETLFTSVTGYTDQLVKKDGSHIDLEELQYKNVILYVDTIPSSCKYDMNILTKWYPKIKQCEPDVEMVFVSYTPPEHGSICRPQVGSEIPWIVYPYDSELSVSLQHHYSFYWYCNGHRILRGLRPSAAIAFGKGGRICVLDLIRYFGYHGYDSNPFAPGSKNLKRDVYCQMRHDIDFLK